MALISTKGLNMVFVCQLMLFTPTTAERNKSVSSQLGVLAQLILQRVFLEKNENKLMKKYIIYCLILIFNTFYYYYYYSHYIV